MPYLLIDPQETLDYSFDWSQFLDEVGSPGDTINASFWAVTPLGSGSPTEPILSNQSNTATTATVFVSNCAAGGVYQLTNTVTTAQGRTAERSIALRCEQR